VHCLVSGSNKLSGVTTGGTPSRSFASDAAGNVTEDTDLATSITKALAYNHPGQLASVEVAASTVDVYTYDHLWRPVSRELPASLTTLHVLHDLDGNVVAEYDSSSTLLREYSGWRIGRSRRSWLEARRSSTRFIRTISNRHREKKEENQCVFLQPRRGCVAVLVADA